MKRCTRPSSGARASIRDATWQVSNAVASGHPHGSVMGTGHRSWYLGEKEKNE